MSVPSGVSRVLLVEHVDATGAAPADARARAVACRAAGVATEVLVLDGRPSEDPLFPVHAAPSGTTIDVFGDDAAGRARLAARVRASRADLVLWASAAPGGGPRAAEVIGARPARWWASGHPGERATAGALPALDPAFAPAGGSAWDAERVPRGRLALWDGPFALVPTRPGIASARLLFDAFAQACRDREELDLVVLDHPRPELEALARAAGIGLRVHFVGPAPREAEHAWLAMARAALVAGEAPLSGGMLLRALGAGLPVLALGPAARAIGEWLAAGGAGPAAHLTAEALGDARRRARPRVAQSPWRARARVAAAAHRPDALAARLAAAFGGNIGRERAA
ncbi:MAG: hypothetical protein U0704_01570 [Candidatus Eisenbacteria bacterium]